MKNIFIIYHGRFPGEKAASLFAAKEAGSLVPFGRVTILVSRILGRVRADAHAYYGIAKEVRIIYLPVLDLRYVPLVRHIAFLISYATFTLSCALYFALHVRASDPVITNEPLPGLAATFFSRKVMLEVHDFPQGWHGFYGALFRRSHTVLCTNEWKKQELTKKFQLSASKFLLERNAVDTEAFGVLSKEDARLKLGLPKDSALVVYTGHLYAHKGVETLAEAAALLPEAQFVFVGGTASDTERFRRQFGSMKNIRLVGQRPHEEIPLWQSAADVVVLPNSAKEDLSARYTSPMKLFEYMASDRPIVASRVSAAAEILPEEAGYFADPDSPDSLSNAISSALAEPQEAAERATRARKIVAEHSWQRRAERLIARLS